ncbi:hypothetical protein ME784_13620 [Lactobacillus delbrueckii]|nr:hypothetical protein ME784_13620 [Lactobacillus delbrueckii]GHN22921.1 hypothetical protein ME785_14790 [Lactobacillus delbrueckii]GHN62328.1 hypothetical protein ME807_07350 [Lactobacillus delbrueckii]
MHKGDLPVFEFCLVEDLVVAVVEGADKGKVSGPALDAQFFFQLSDDGCQGLISGSDVAGRRGVKATWVGVLIGGPFLQEDLPFAGFLPDDSN